MIRFFQFLFLPLFAIMMVVGNVNGQEGGANVITTAVPFLSITPDSRIGGMGDAGVGADADVSSQHWNPAKYVFMESDMGIGLSYSPWLSNLVDDINLAYLTFYKKIDDVQGISSSLRYFGLGDITFTSDDGTYQGQYSPNEFAIDIAYSRKLSEMFSGSVALRYVRSDLTSGQLGPSGEETHAGNAFASDVAFYYYNEFRRKRKDNSFAAGINIQNIGSKISYTEGTVKDFIPTTLRLGASYGTEMDQYNSLMFSLELSKLLVPTPNDTTSRLEYSKMGPIEGIFKSFADAPGGFKEEMQEIMVGVGLEYWYNKQFALRGGYFYEHENKGNRKYFSAGAGLKMNVFSLDFSYLFPAAQSNHPLENTMRFTLAFDIDAFSNQR